MATLTHTSQLTDGSEVTITVATKKITLNIAGNLTTDGVTMQCLYSWLKERWAASATYVKYPFPMTAITSEQFELINGWDLYNNSSKQLIRTGGWALKDPATGLSQEEWAGIITLGSLGGTDQVYYTQTSNATSGTNIVLTGAVNQAVKVYGDASHDNFDYRGYMKLFCRTYQKTYATSQLSDIGVSSMTYQVYRFPLSNASDIKVTHADGTMSGAPYSGMSITWYAAPQTRSIGGVDKYFHIIINGNSGTAEQIYEYAQYQLRQATDVDTGSGTKYGKLTSSLLNFVGSDLYTLVQTEGGVFIDNYQTTDINRLHFADDSSATITFPYVAAVTLNFGSNLVADADAKYWLFFTSAYGTASAIIVQDATPANITGSISGNSSITFTFGYDSNEQGGRTKATDALVTAVAIGKSTGQFVSQTGTITRSTANSISLASALERNYAS